MDEAARVLDLSGAEQDCSGSPLDRLRTALDGLPGGRTLEVRSPVADHAFMVRAYVRRSGGVVVGDERVGDEWRIVVRAGA